MVLYLDVILFLNFIVNYCFMKLIYILFKEKESIRRLILSSVLSLCLLLCFLLNYYLFNIVKIIGGMFLISVAFKYSNKTRYIFMCALYYILQYAFIGVLTIFNVKGLACLVFLLLVCLLVLIYSRRSHILPQKTYKVIVEINNKKYNIDGFLDTGNIACYYDLPIIFLDYKYYDNTLKEVGVIEVNTISGTGIIKCFKPDHFYILENNKRIEKDVLVSFYEFKDQTNCLLNYLLFI